MLQSMMKNELDYFNLFWLSKISKQRRVFAVESIAVSLNHYLRNGYYIPPGNGYYMLCVGVKENMEQLMTDKEQLAKQIEEQDRIIGRPTYLFTLCIISKTWKTINCYKCVFLLQIHLIISWMCLTLYCKHFRYGLFLNTLVYNIARSVDMALIGR